MTQLAKSVFVCIYIYIYIYMYDPRFYFFCFEVILVLIFSYKSWNLGPKGHFRNQNSKLINFLEIGNLVLL